MNLFDDYCNLCEPFPLSAHIQSALFEKYSTSINFYYSQHIDPILNDSLKPVALDFREAQYLSDDNECLKRIYAI